MKDLTIDDIRAWLGGVADAATTEAAEAAWAVRGSDVWHYCQWQSDPARYVADYGDAPEIVREWIDDLPVETARSLSRITEDLPAGYDSHFGWYDPVEPDFFTRLHELVRPRPLLMASVAWIAGLLSVALIYAALSQIGPLQRAVDSGPIQERGKVPVIAGTDELRGLERRVAKATEGLAPGEPLFANVGTMQRLRDDVRAFQDKNPASRSPVMLDFLLRLRQPSDQMQIMVPAYFYPKGPELEKWNDLIAVAQRVPIIAIANVNNGPAAEPNQDYQDVIRKATKGGVTVIGYVACGDGKRPVAEVEEDIARWARWYPGVTGIFFDVHPMALEGVPFSEGVIKTARASIRDALVVCNPGTVVAEEYFTVANPDMICIFRNSKGFSQFKAPGWAAKYPPRRLAALQWNARGEEAVDVAMSAAVANRIGCLFITDDSGKEPDDIRGINPWSRLPTYWEREVRMIEEFNLKCRSAVGPRD